jgi:drug/metabolite transporter (DMT)-like permease
MVVTAFLSTFGNISVKYASYAMPNNFAWTMWIIFNKSACSLILCWSWVIWSLVNRTMPKMSVPLIILTLVNGVLMQYGGDINYQLALTRVGLATAVPVNFCCLIISGALLSRVCLGESLTFRSMMSQAVLMGAISLIGLSRGTQAGAASEFSPWVGIFYACCSGTCYGIGGVLLRYISQRQPILLTMALITLPGTPIFGIYGFTHLGVETLTNIPLSFHLALVGSALLNTMGFFLVLRAVRGLPIVLLNSISSSQIMLSALAGVMIFSESMSIYLCVGIGLTILGLLITDRGRQPAKIKIESEPTILPIPSAKIEANSPVDPTNMPNHQIAV